MEKFRILVTDGVSAKGVELLTSIPQFEVEEIKGSLKEEELIAKIPNIDALIVRSQTKVSAKALKAAGKLKIVGRAGVGVDNVDVDTATEQGVVVMNTPSGNTISTAEHTFSMILSLARNIPQAHQSMKEGKWDRKSFQGIEMNGKTLGILGMGRIGTEVARRAFAFGMRVLAYDPYLSASRARSLQVELFESLDEMLPHCDFITLHMPLTDETKNLLSRDRINRCKQGARIINCARGGLIEEPALVDALKSNHIGGVALDVYEQEPPPADYPLRPFPQVVMTPHLAASTFEAQESVGIEIAEAVRDMLVNGSIRNAVNMPNVDAKTLATLRPYLDFSRKLGLMLAQVAPARSEQLTISYYGKFNDYDTTPITRSVLKGFLRHAIGTHVNEVNAPKFAENLGIKFSETKKSDIEDYSELIAISVQSNGQKFEICGTFFGNKPRLVRINDHRVEAALEGVLFMFENKDRPGVVGWIGTMFGKNGVNIANMSLSRSEPGSRALCVLNLDSMPPREVIEEIRNAPDIFSVQAVQL